MPVVIEDFLQTRDALRFCPHCAARLYVDIINSAILVCPMHGPVFAIYQTTGGYSVEVNVALS